MNESGEEFCKEKIEMFQGAMRTVECLASEVSSRISRKGDGLSVQKVNDLLDKMCSKEDKHPGEIKGVLEYW